MAKEPDDNGMLEYRVAEPNSPQEMMIQAMHYLAYGHQVNVVQDALVNVLAEVAVTYGTDLERLLAGVRTAFRFHAEQRVSEAPDPMAKRGEA